MRRRYHFATIATWDLAHLLYVSGFLGLAAQERRHVEVVQRHIRHDVTDVVRYLLDEGALFARCLPAFRPIGRPMVHLPAPSFAEAGAPLGEARSPVRDDSGYRKVANSDCAPYPFSQPAVWKKQRSRRLTPEMTGGCTPSISALNAGNFGPSPPGGERRVRWCAVTRPGQPRVRRLIARSARSERWY